METWTAMAEAAAAPRPAYPLTQSIAGCLAGAIGTHGVTASDLTATLRRLDVPLADLQRDKRDRRPELLSIADETADIAAATAALDALSEGASTIVFLGTGGSSLGGQTLAQFGGWNIPGLLDKGQRGRPRTRFYDNLDGHTLGSALATLDYETTRFVVISKSGGTVETLAQAVCVIDAMRRAGLEQRIGASLLGITEPARPGKSNPLRELLGSFGVPMLDHPTGIGGRFSVLSVVGLVPALARGLDVHAIRAGARDVLAALERATRPEDFAPALAAAAAVALREHHGAATHVIMPYADRLGRFSHWFVQLWAESLGKDGKGTSPIACVGPLDQHSQLQLFMDGPREHLMTIIRTGGVDTSPRIAPDLAQRAGIGFLGDRSIGELVTAQAHAVPEALMKAGRPVRTIDLAQLDARTMGALLMHFMLETILVARLLGIDPFDQPAVELAKRLTRERFAG